MKRVSKKDLKMAKGMPSAVMLSIVIHGVLFLVAGMLVIFTVTKKEEKKFEPPQLIERPKMKLKKPKVKVKKTSKPKPTTRIVTKMKNASMPEIHLPEISSLDNGGFGGGIEGFDLTLDLGKSSVFGSEQSIGNDFEGTLYDLKRQRNGRPDSIVMDYREIYDVVRKFIKGGWNPSTLGRYYRSSNKLYSPTIMIPSIPSQFAPWSFNEPNMAAYAYMLHYKGQLVHPEGGRFRFLGMGDDFLVVRVNGRVVLDWANIFRDSWSGKRSKLSNYHLGHASAWVGQWMDLEPGVPLDMEVIFGEASGGLFAAMLVVEEEGVDYPNNFEHGPMLPIFKTAELTRDQVDSIYEFLYEDHYSVTNGPVFSDYVVSKSKSVSVEKAPVVGSASEGKPADKMRSWTLGNGKVIEAELAMQFGDKVILKSANGKEVKIPVMDFSAEDLDYLELASPPPLKITFLKETDIFDFEDMPNAQWPVVMRETMVGVKIEKINNKPYKRELKVELYSFSSEIDGDNYILMDRTMGAFIPSKASVGGYELWGKKAYAKDYHDAPPSRPQNRRGEKFTGYMIVVIDERGEVIAQNTSNDWMLENIDFLRELPIGRHFNKDGVRVYPPRAPLMRHFW